MASSSSTYRTSILDGWNPDPSMIKVDDDYFLCTSSFEYFPGLPIYHSKDLINWKLINHACTRRSQLDLRTCEAGGGLFAPSIRYHNGRIYVTCCQMQNSDSEGGYRVSRYYLVERTGEELTRETLRKSWRHVASSSRPITSSNMARSLSRRGCITPGSTKMYVSASHPSFPVQKR